MKILTQALEKINTLCKSQRTFFILLIQGFIGSQGKKTFRNIARYIDCCEKTISRQMKKPFDFMSLNTEMIKAAKNEKDEFIVAQDASFISKSGTKTYGRDSFWNGSTARAEKGLETDVIAVIKTNDATAYTISSKQTPANPIPKTERTKKTNNSLKTRIDFYLEHFKKTAPHLIELNVKHAVVDAYFAKNKYVQGVCELGFHVISKMRKDAKFCYLYTGPQKKRGRKKKYDTKKFQSTDFDTSEVIKIEKEGVELRSLDLYSVSLKRVVRVVLVKKLINGKQGQALLFSTDIKQNPAEIYKMYTLRFQIEFIFRDAKGFTGLGDCQSLDKERLNYHFNASFVALNVTRLQDQEIQKNSSIKKPFSMASWARKYHLDIVLNRFISMFGFDQTFIKLHANYNKALQFGSIEY